MSSIILTLSSFVILIKDMITVRLDLTYFKGTANNYFHIIKNNTNRVDRISEIFTQSF